MSASLPDELNTFYARFESTSPAVEVQKAQEDHCPPVISRADVCRTLKRINTRKAPGPDGIPGRALKVCADQLADVFADIFNMSLLQSVVPTCFKETIIVPVPKKTKILSLNDYRPVALTSTIMKCFERLVKSFITSSIPDSLDPLQFAYRPNRSTEDAIALTLHTALSHLDQRDTYVRMLFIDYSSAFNTIVPSKLVTKLRDLGLNSALCDWILNFLTGRPQAVRMGSTTSSTLTLNTGAPQGCVLSPLLYSLFTHDCVATHSSNTIIKFADDTTVIGLITGDDMRRPTERRRRQREEHAPLSINGTTVERVSSSFRFLGVHISEDLTWTHHTDFITKSARQQALLPPQAAEAQHGLKDPLQLLQVHHREYPDWLHHCLLQYRAGKQNQDADGLSRRPHSRLPDDTSSQKELERIQQFTKRHLSEIDYADLNENTIKAICEKHLVHQVISHHSGETSPYITLVVSRAHHPKALPESFEEEDQLGGLPVIPLLTPAELRDKQKADICVGEVLRQVESGERAPPSLRKELPELGLFLREWNKLEVLDGVLYRKRQEGAQTQNQLVLPEDLRPLVLKSLHGNMGHMGVERTLDLIRKGFYWPKMSAEVEAKIKTCNRCIWRKTMPEKAAPLVNIVATRPLELECMDFFSVEPGHCTGEITLSH
ncbi:hypothetical protein L3Q82_000942 [Scortum barcoo]|uniref:Uncharacterized protein n=1 Tax=Scortum barcoo TaxID=214431 RepID=A0ACB8WBG5_9TELE|nr:hypothetical protein L3Q82_000942 [Scortum barcoo]